MVTKSTMKLNLPGTLIPMATANTMLIVGSSKDQCDCEFPLQYFLVIAGGIGLCLIVMDVLAQYVINWVLEDNKITDIEQKVLTCVKIAGFVLAFIQLVALIGQVCHQLLQAMNPVRTGHYYLASVSSNVYQ